MATTDPAGSNMIRQGFTLLELSIVLVIIGLIVGGVMAGRELIKNAELNAVGTENQRFLTAIHAFKYKYMALPGDIQNAHAYWGAAAGCTDAEATPGGTGCNGNGDGFIVFNDEGYRAWQHLAQAGLVDTSVSGTSSGGEAVVGVNVPTSSIDAGGYSIVYISSNSSSPQLTGRNHIYLGAARSGSFAANGLLSAADAKSIDLKFDDGASHHGRVFGNRGGDFVGGCVGGTYPNRDYTGLSSDDRNCVVIFSID